MSVSTTTTTGAQTFNRLYYFERAAETCVKALWTGKPMRVMNDELAERVAPEMVDYPDQADCHFSDPRELLEREEPDYCR